MVKKPGYSLNIDSKPIVNHSRTYRQKELEEMTTFQLREICTKEKIIKGITNPLNRYELMETIIRYRGEKETLLIHKFCEGGYERIEQIIQKKLGSVLKDEGTIRNPARFIVYNDLDMSLYDQYQVEIDHQKKDDISKAVVNRLGESNVLLVGENNELCGIFNLVGDGKTPEKFYLCKGKDIQLQMKNHRHYSLLYFEKKESDYLYNTYYDIKQANISVLHYYKIPLADIEVRTSEETEAILSIDFGTSNTTAGTYLDYHYIPNPDSQGILNGRNVLDAINIVQFLDTTKGEKEWSPLLPTAVSVLDCSDPEHVQYQFGYEAKKANKIKYYDETFSIFYEIKRWVNSYEQQQEITDKQGHIASVCRKEIIREYLLYVIRCAQQRFKCRFRKLHLTSPVKLKAQFSKMFCEILPEYEIETEQMLDEGTAVVYNTIANLIEKQRFYDNEVLSALIIDCGGGTTDLSSCSFSIHNDAVAYDVAIKTTYENGDTNFGGNNITYRIMQYIKIMFATYYSANKTVKINDLITVPTEDVFRYVDEYGKEKVYETLEQEYDKAEAIIPTKFKHYENRTREEYFMVKNNFYFLFDIADQLKKQFYISDSVIRNRFQSNYEQEDEDLKITRIERWNLVVNTGERLEYNHSFPDVIFNIKEIELLLKADIYEIVNKFLYEFYRNNTLSSYSIIKLTGQSCRIDIFREALKEFIPGRNIEFKYHGNDTTSITELKLACVKGAIQYVNASKIGYTNVSLAYCTPMIPYSVSGFTHENQEKMLIYSLDQEQRYGFLSRNKSISHLELFLKDGSGKLQHRYSYQNDYREYHPVLYEEIAEKYAEYAHYIIQDDTDDIVDTEVKFFVFAANDQWGFYLLPIAREGNQLFMGREEFYTFENDVWEVDFFDGTK